MRLSAVWLQSCPHARHFKKPMSTLRAILTVTDLGWLQNKHVKVVSSVLCFFWGGGLWLARELAFTHVDGSRMAKAKVGRCCGRCARAWN